MISENSGEFYPKVWYNYNNFRKYRERAREGLIWNAEIPDFSGMMPFSCESFVLY